MTADDLDAYLHDLLASERSRAAITDRIIEIRRMWAWQGLLPADDRLPEAPPWGGENANTVVGHRPTQGENRTPRIHPDTMDRLLCWALRFVDTFADDIIAAAHQHRRLYHRSAKPHRGRSPRRSHRRGELERELRALIERHRASGTPLPGIVDDPLSPEPRRQRERHALEQLEGIINEHERTGPGVHPASSTGSAADAQ